LGGNAFPVPSAASTTAMTYDVDNRLATFNGQATAFDADGNLLALPGGSPASYTYDARNRLMAAGGVSYAYDPEWDRVGVTGSTGTTTYVVNPNSTLTQTLMATGPDGTVTHYVYGLGLAYQEFAYLNRRASHRFAGLRKLQQERHLALEKLSSLPYRPYQLRII
jgi:hypothetical protein